MPKAPSIAPTSPSTAVASTRCRVRTDDGRIGTAIYEVTGSHHHRYFPDTVVEETLPS